MFVNKKKLLIVEQLFLNDILFFVMTLALRSTDEQNHIHTDTQMLSYTYIDITKKIYNKSSRDFTLPFISYFSA